MHALSPITQRFRNQPAWAVVMELFIGLGWLRAAAAKVIDARWWTGDYLRTFLDDHATESLGWFVPFADGVVVPLAPLVAAVVLAAQIGVGTCLALGRYRLAALGGGITMNLAFVAAGAVTPSAFYLIIQMALAFWVLDRATRSRIIRPMVAAVGVAVAAFNIPFVSTLHPDAVIEDPALMLITIGALTATGAVVGAVSAPTEDGTGDAPQDVMAA